MTDTPKRPGNSKTRHGNGNGRGPGWGGPAKGADPVRAEKAPDFELGNQVTPAKRRPENIAKRQWREMRTEALEDRLMALALEADREDTSVQAAARLHAIYNGQVVRYEAGERDQAIAERRVLV